MDDRYLWDRTGTPDPFTVRIETALAPIRARMTGSRRGRRALGLVGLVSVAAAAAVILWIAVGTSDGPSPATAETDGAPVAMETGLSDAEATALPDSPEDR